MGVSVQIGIVRCKHFSCSAPDLLMETRVYYAIPYLLTYLLMETRVPYAIPYLLTYGIPYLLTIHMGWS